MTEDAADPRRTFGTNDAAQAILTLLERRGAGKTICPSEAARSLAGEDREFRPYMAVVRDAARALVADGRIEVMQKRRVIDLDKARGPIRLRAVPVRVVEDR